MKGVPGRLMGLFGVVIMLAVAVAPALADSPVSNTNTPDRQQISSQPRRVVGGYETTNPLYGMIGARTGVLLYDLSGQINEDYNFVPPEETQVLGRLAGDIMKGSYIIELPDDPQGTLLDFDGDSASPPAIQVYTPALFIDFLGDDYVNRGESPMNMSVRLESLTYHMVGGSLVVWAEVDGALFPGEYGPDGVLFTDDDVLVELPQGWSIIALDAEPFTIVRNPTVDVPLVESMGALNDYSTLSYRDAWQQLYERARTTYPFTVEKQIDWDNIYQTITPLVEQADSDLAFHLVMSSFGAMIPDTHVGYVSLPVMQTYLLGGVGIRQITLTDDNELVVTSVADRSPAQEAGLTVGALLETVDGQPALQVLEETPLLINSASTEHTRRHFQASTMLQGPVGSSVELGWRAPDGSEKTAQLTRTPDVMSLLMAFDSRVPGRPVITSRMLESGLGYIGVFGFAEQVSEIDAWFTRELQGLIDAGAKGIIIDVRDNGGGLVYLSMAIAGHFFEDYTRLFDFYYADGTGGFAYRGFIEILKSEPYYDGPVAVLVNQMTGSAGDMFAYAMKVNNRAVIVGHSPTGGFTGEVSDGQYSLPGNLTMQIPTGRAVDPATGRTLLEGVGGEPDIRVPLTLESLLSPEDEVLIAAEEALLAQ